MNIAGNLENILNELPDNVKLIPVSKTKPVEDIMKAYNAGYKIFGENRAQELSWKYNELPKDIEWHMIGHLQTNKVKYIAPFVTMIHSVDSFKLLKIINREAQKNERTIDCLLQVHIAREETKFGFDMDEVGEMVDSDDFKALNSINVKGLMGMATFTNNEDDIRSEFRYLAECYNLLKEKYFFSDPGFSEISMGMSGDYKIAIEEGSTMVRVGSLIFGERH